MEAVVGEVELVLVTKVAGEVELIQVTKVAGVEVMGGLVELVLVLNMETLAGEVDQRKLPTLDGLETDRGGSGWWTVHVDLTTE